MKKLFLVTLLTSLMGFVNAAELDPANTNFTWKASKKTGSTHSGPISLKEGKPTFDKKGNFTGGEFIMDLNAFDVTDLEGEWKTKFIGHIKSPDFFDTEKFPTAKLVIESIKGDKVNGKLTLKDKTEAVSFNAKKDKKSFTGTLTFDRTKWGLIYGSGNFFKELTADKIISDNVSVDFKVSFK